VFWRASTVNWLLWGSRTRLRLSFSHEASNQNQQSGRCATPQAVCRSHSFGLAIEIRAATMKLNPSRADAEDVEGDDLGPLIVLPTIRAGLILTLLFCHKLWACQPDSPSRCQLSQVLKDASSVNFEVRDNIPGVSYSSGMGVGRGGSDEPPLVDEPPMADRRTPRVLG
jgi:hypothetical protein